MFSLTVPFVSFCSRLLFLIFGSCTFETSWNRNFQILHLLGKYLGHLNDIITWLFCWSRKANQSAFCDAKTSTCLYFSFDTEKRYQVAKEILETEKKYLSCLRTLKEVRFVRLYSRSCKSKWTLICVVGTRVFDN